MTLRLGSLAKTAATYLMVIAAGCAFGWVVAHSKEWMTPDFHTGDYQSYYAAQGPKVALYGTSWCPACASARETLTSMGVSYSDFDIEKSEEAKSRYLETGEQSIPVIFIQDRMFVGANTVAISKTITEFGLAKKAN